MKAAARLTKVERGADAAAGLGNETGAGASTGPGVSTGTGSAISGSG